MVATSNCCSTDKELLSAITAGLYYVWLQGGGGGNALQQQYIIRLNHAKNVSSCLAGFKFPAAPPTDSSEGLSVDWFDLKSVRSLTLSHQTKHGSDASFDPCEKLSYTIGIGLPQKFANS